ncbi:MAG: hypothetical protein G01um101448_623 [Parcubacteria group bacterium Gr01-1014_48]|nr:MAG: hypothetical protein Greene041614_987 [Parcubacteria group bacterium Greene0416_14]TSC73676.1 MAG: hypothetical protein G01um101448_623 [Parcubacteria group bacterium Gr01-1014_48]TSD00256.1 MAG: hypothetical protein Greene101415_915 [Parcubacteria group bacterium Greene1014_15]TSD06906.1 MAG: hypothetical protein Greene07144_1073 [Parcubacteria group bacterium Greene0714_4]
MKLEWSSGCDGVSIAVQVRVLGIFWPLRDRGAWGKIELTPNTVVKVRRFVGRWAHQPYDWYGPVEFKGRVSDLINKKRVAGATIHYK